jgi:hypothetical protein
MSTPSIAVSALKNRPNAYVTARVREAVADGTRVLDVVNRGKPVARLALAEDMPEEWRATEPDTVALNELKRSEISISGLRREGRALYLSQRSGPTLGLWPVSKAYTRSAELGLPEEVDELRRELNELRDRLERMERGIGSVAKLLTLVYPVKRRTVAGEEDGSEDGS